MFILMLFFFLLKAAVNACVNMAIVYSVLTHLFPVSVAILSKVNDDDDDDDDGY